MRRAVLLLIVLSAGHAAKLELLGMPHERVADEYFIGFHDDAESTAHFLSVKTNWSQHFSNEPEHLGESLGMNLLYVRLSEDEVKHVEDNIAGIEYMHHNLVAEHYQTRTQDRATPSLDRIDGRRDGRYTYRSDGTGCDVFVLDTGIQTTNRGWDGQASFMADCTLARRCLTGGANDRQDPGGHGTHVAGSVASRRYGVAKGARVRNVRVLGNGGRGSTAGIIRGINEVVEQRRREDNRRPGVINMSLGGGRSTAFNRAVNRAVQGAGGGNNQPITIVVAAGNSNQNAANASPASAERAITVGSSQANDVRSSFSNFGSVVDIFAVGSRVQSLYPDSDGSRTLSGTSMAAPHVAGAACQLLSVNPNLSPGQVENILIATAQTGVLRGLPAGTPNRLLNIADERFGNSRTNTTLRPTGPPETDPPILVPTNPGQPDTCFSTRTRLGGDLERGFQSRGVMFDLQVNAEDVRGGQAPTIESITVYTADRVTGGSASVYFTSDRRTYKREAVAFDSGRWTPVMNRAGQEEVRVNSAAQRVLVGDRLLFPNVVVLPEPHELTTGAQQGIYVVFTSENMLAVDDRNADLPGNFVFATDGVVNLIPGRLVAGMFSNRGRSIVAPLVDLCYSTVTGNLGRVEDEPAPVLEARLSDNLDCVQNEIINGSEFTNNQNGVMFDLSVNELAAADLPGVYLESFSVFLMDSMQHGVAEVWTTVNGLSYAGQEYDSSLWRQIAVIDGVDKELTRERDNEEENAEISDGSVGAAADEDEIVMNDPIERPAVPELVDLDFSMNFALRTDGSKQGFYVTFRENQMEYYADESVIESAEIASNRYVTISGGKGVRYPFAEIFDRRQFAGQACLSYAPASRAGTGSGPVEGESAASSSLSPLSLLNVLVLGVSLIAMV